MRNGTKQSSPSRLKHVFARPIMLFIKMNLLPLAYSTHPIAKAKVSPYLQAIELGFDLY